MVSEVLKKLRMIHCNIKYMKFGLTGDPCIFADFKTISYAACVAPVIA